MSKTHKTFGMSLLAFVGATLWYRWDVSRQQAMNYMLSSAAAGNLNSVKHLCDINSAESISRLRELAKDESADSRSRVKAIECLGEKKSDEEDLLVSLIAIGEPFVIRHAAARALLPGNCKESCVSAALHELHSILGGQPTLEMTLHVPPGPTPNLTGPKLVEQVEQLKAATIDDYLGLLGRDPCLTWKLIQENYKDDSTLISEINSKIGHCDGLAR